MTIHAADAWAVARCLELLQSIPSRAESAGVVNLPAALTAVAEILPQPLPIRSVEEAAAGICRLADRMDPAHQDCRAARGGPRLIRCALGEAVSEIRAGLICGVLREAAQALQGGGGFDRESLAAQLRGWASSLSGE